MYESELIKMWKKKGTKIIILIILCCSTLLGILSGILNKSNQSKDWKEDTRKLIEADEAELEKNLNNSDLDDDIKELLNESLTEDILLNEYSIEHNIPYIVNTRWKTLYDNLSSICALIIFLTIGLTVNSMVGEYTFGTIKLLVTNSDKRWYILTAKILSIISYATAFILSSSSVLLIIGCITYKENNYITLSMDNGVIHEINMLTSVFTSLILYIILSLLLIIVAIGLAVFSRNTTVSILGTLVVWLGDSFFGIFLGNYSWYKYTPFSVINLDNYFNNGNIVTFNYQVTLQFILLCIYITVLIVGIFWSFCKKDIPSFE